MEQIVDYAMPMMIMEKALRKAHDLCLECKYGEAREVALQIATEARLLQQTLRLMEEREAWLRTPNRSRSADTATAST